MKISKESLLDKGLSLVPVKELEIKYDPNQTVGYDLTVDDFYTFSTDDGVFVQDCMAVYIPVTERSKKDISNKIMVQHNLLSPANGELVMEPNQDIVLGLYSLTKDNEDEEVFEYTKKVIKNNKEEEIKKAINKGLCIFNDCLPKTYPVIIDKPVTKKLLTIILNRIAQKCTTEELKEALDKIKDLGFQCSTSEGFSLSLFDLYHPKLEEISTKLVGDYRKDTEFIKENKELKEIMQSMSFASVIESGARGSWAQAQQLVFSRGYVTDHLNKIRNKLIKSSFVKGLTEEEYFDSSWGARKGLLDTALSSGDSGYLTRQLIYSTQFVELDDKLEDCGTEDYLEIDLKEMEDSNKNKNKSFIYSLKHRYIKIFDKDNNTWGSEILVYDPEIMFNQLVDKKIRLRSPIYCKSKHICKKCYGEFYKVLNSNKIGIISTQCIGERLTQLVLRTFHFSGAKFGEKEDIISGMAIAKKCFHNPNFVSPPNEPEKLLIFLFKLFSNYGNIYLVHLETIISSMLWGDNDKLWRTIKDREKHERYWNSILKIPSLKSWLIGCAFSNLKSKLLDGLVRDRVDEETVLTSLFRL